MKHVTLQALTWTTIAAAVGSALWLAAAESSVETARQTSSANVAMPNQRAQPRSEVVPVVLRTSAHPRLDSAASLRAEAAEPVPTAR